jgi:hypothetical protein
MTADDPSAPAPPPQPEKPEAWECCSRGCCPCIFDYYWDAMSRWEAAVRALGLDPEVLKAEQAAKHG